ncbi:MAG: DUF3604 domain-containing protein [Armatimonadota bacterium]
MDPRLINEAREALLWTTWRLQLTIPSVLATGEQFALRITAFGPDGIPSGDFPREIRFEASPGIAGLPESVRFFPADGGHIVLEALRAVGPEHAFVVAQPDGCPSRVHSNPAWVMDDPPYRIFWGDLHQHTTYSNCSGWACKDPEFCYEYAREATHLDFAAAADHLRGIHSEDGRWARLQELVRLYDEPGSFVPFLGFESSHKTGFGGDNNAYYLDREAPYFWIDRDDMRGVSPEVTLRQLWDFLDATEKPYFTAPHHTGRAGKYRSFADPAYDPACEPLFEIFSMWGSSESRWNSFPLYAGNSDEPCYFQDALRAGCRYGLIASSDDHRTLPGGEGKARQALGLNNLATYVHHGLAAVRAQELSRESLFSALRERSCYATTQARVLLDVQMGDLSMGQEGAVSSSDPLRSRREIRVKALTTEPGRADVVLVRNGEEIQREQWDSETPELVFEDAAPLDDIALRDAQFHPEPFVVYYVRLENQFNQTQWSSPIWLDA